MNALSKSLAAGWRDPVRIFEQGRVFLGDGKGIDDVEVDLLFNQGAFQAGGKLVFQLFPGPGAVQEEGSAFGKPGRHIVKMDVVGLVAGHEIRVVHQVGGFDGLVTETQMGHGDPA